MKKYLSVIVIISAGLVGCSTSTETINIEPPKRHQYKVHPRDFAGEIQDIELTNPQNPTVKIKFNFRENGPPNSDHPLYIIPPDIGGVHWTLTRDGKSYGPVCGIKAYKLNPDVGDRRRKGNLKRVTSPNYNKVINIRQLLRGQNVSAGTYTFEVTYSWLKIDPEINNGYCVDAQLPESCFTIFQGEMTRRREIILQQDIP